MPNNQVEDGGFEGNRMLPPPLPTKLQGKQAPYTAVPLLQPHHTRTNVPVI